MSNPVPSIKLDNKTVSPEARTAETEVVEKSPTPKEERLEAMELPVTDTDVHTPAEEGFSATEDKAVVKEENSVPVGNDSLSAPEEKDSPADNNKESVLTPTEKEPSVVSMDKDTTAGVKESPKAVTGKENILTEERAATSDKGPLSTATDGKSPSVVDAKEHPSPSTVDKEHLPTTADVESPAEEESHLVATDKEGFTAIYRESPPAATTEAPSVPTDKGPLQVTSQEEPSSATAYRESPPTVTVEEPPSVFAEKAPEQVVAQPEPPATMEEEYPPIVTYKEHPPAVSVEEPPSTATEEVAGIIERISVVPEPVAVPPEPPAEVIEEVPAWEIWHTDPAEHVLLAVAITLVAGKVGGETARLLGVPAVVGKIIIGMILGNIYLLSGWDFFNFLRVMPFLKHLSDLGALTLLLTIGLRTNLGATLRVGVSSVLVALGGLVAPAGLGFLVGHFLLPESPFNTKLLLSIVLCASSMGIILKVLDELKMLHTLEGRIITGAVILGDAVTLLGFGVACGIITSGQIPLVGVIITIIIVSFFFSAIVITSLRYGEVLGNFVTRKVPEGLKLAMAVTLCLVLAFLAESIGMHTIVGAFAAGLLLQHMRLKESDGKEYSIEWLIRPAYMILVPIFFVRAGAQVRWESFLDTNTVILGLALTGASILGKLFCSLCPVERGINRLAIGLAMVPKLEVTLILASIGRGIGVLDDAIFSAFVMLIVLTSTVSPPFLKMVLLRKKSVPEGPPVPFGEGVRVTSR